MGWVFAAFFSGVLSASPCGRVLTDRAVSVLRAQFVNKAPKIKDAPGGVSFEDETLGIRIRIRSVEEDRYLASIDVTDPPPPSAGRDGGGGNEDDDSKSGSSESDGKKAESLKSCLSRNAILFSTSSAANLVGAYAAFSEVKWDPSLPWYAANLQWVVEKTRRGFATPQDYGKAFLENPDFRYNNVWNAVLMFTLAGGECFLAKKTSTAVVMAMTLVSSVASQMMTKGEVSLSQTALDVAFVRFASLPRARLGAAVDRSFFQRHPGMIRMGEVSVYYLTDQYLGGFAYGLLQNTVIVNSPTGVKAKIDR